MTENIVLKCIRESSMVVASLEAQHEAIHNMSLLLVDVLGAGGTIFSAGNGGSAAEAMHLSEELVGRYRSDRPSLPAMCLNADATALTCIANDYGFERIFSRQVESLCRQGDLLVLFSTSGNSENLNRALDVALAAGVKTFCLLGKDGGAMKGKADCELIVDHQDTARIQEAHQVIMHIMLEIVEQAYV
jgi:D-sedoheptulose 7-phosphate isomerase